MDIIKSNIIESAVDYCLKNKKFININNKHCSVVFYKKNIYTKSVNTFDGHAEINSLVKLSLNHKKIKKFNILVIRLGTDITFGNSKPCLYCLEYLHRFYNQCKYVYYSTGNEREIKREKLNTIKTEHVSKSKKYLKVKC